ncbi:26S proteasome complex subunit [Trapelia coarctata]|nr:26S proteasome complex subunit [Trapelia coarctata]
MSAPAAGTAGSSKVEPSSSETKEVQKPTTALEEDDEFEDFPVEDWPKEDAEVPAGNTHLWEESWDDDDTSDDFSKILKEELEKVKTNKK